MSAKQKAVVARVVLYPVDVQVMLNVSESSRWRLEREGKLPPRDVFLGGVAVGWRPETIERALSTPDPQADRAFRATKAANAKKARRALDRARRPARRGTKGDGQGVSGDA